MAIADYGSVIDSDKHGEQIETGGALVAIESAHKSHWESELAPSRSLLASLPSCY